MNKIDTPNYFPAESNASPRTLIVSCGDPRYFHSIWEFIHQDLGLGPGDFVPQPYPGCVAGMHVPEERLVIIKHLAFYLGHFPTINMIVLINHQGCGKYASLMGETPDDLLLIKGQQLRDLRGVSQKLGVTRPIKFELYYMRIHPEDPNQVWFDKI